MENFVITAPWSALLGSIQAARLRATDGGHLGRLPIDRRALNADEVIMGVVVIIKHFTRPGPGIAGERPGV